MENGRIRIRYRGGKCEEKHWHHWGILDQLQEGLPETRAAVWVWLKAVWLKRDKGWGFFLNFLLLPSFKKCGTSEKRDGNCHIFADNFCAILPCLLSADDLISWIFLLPSFKKYGTSENRDGNCHIFADNFCAILPCLLSADDLISWIFHHAQSIGTFAHWVPMLFKHFPVDF